MAAVMTPACVILVKSDIPASSTEPFDSTIHCGERAFYSSRAQLGSHSHGEKVLLRWSGLRGCGAALTACSYVLGPSDPRPPEPTPQELPAVRKIIANSPDTIFDA